MKRSLVITWVVFFVVSITAKDITAVTWEIWYQVNKEYVARELCVNKAKPAMHCNGKCHLMKQLKQLEEPAPVKKTPVKPLKVKSHDWEQTDLFSIIEEPGNFNLAEAPSWPNQKMAASTFNASCFHPPSQA